MPRRRATKASGNKRPAPAMPEGDEGKDLCREKRREKVQTLMRDFKAEVDSRIRCLNASVLNLTSQLQLACTMELMNIPQRIRQMPLSEFLKNGGVFEESEVGKMLGDKLTSILEDDNLRKDHNLEGIDESSESVVKPVRPTGRRKKGQAVAANGPPRTTRRGQSRNVMATPAMSFNLTAATPLITPKFDPRLYQTPAVQKRVPKPGEVIMSIEGSPLHNPHPNAAGGAAKVGTVTLTLNDQVVVLDKNIDYNQIDISQVDQSSVSEALEAIRKMEAKLKSVSSYGRGPAS